MPINSIDSQYALLSVKNLHGCICIDCPFNNKVQIRYARKTKRNGIISSIFELFPLLVRFSPLIYLLCEIHCNYPLTTTQGDRFASCDKDVSRSHPRLFLRLPPKNLWNLIWSTQNKPPVTGVVNVSLANSQQDLSSQNDKGF